MRWSEHERLHRNLLLNPRYLLIYEPMGVARADVAHLVLDGVVLAQEFLIVKFLEVGQHFLAIIEPERLRLSLLKFRIYDPKQIFAGTFDCLLDFHGINKVAEAVLKHIVSFVAQ